MKGSDMLLVGLAGFVAYEFFLKPKQPVIYPSGYMPGALPIMPGNSTTTAINAGAGLLSSLIPKLFEPPQSQSKAQGTITTSAPVYDLGGTGGGSIFSSGNNIPTTSPTSFDPYPTSLPITNLGSSGYVPGGQDLSAGVADDPTFDFSNLYG